MGASVRETQVVVIGGGPGGYAAAFRAADLGLKTVLVDSRERPGGVCLCVGCIPSKALLFVSELLGRSREAEQFGIEFADPRINLKKLREWKAGVVGRLTRGLSDLAKKRGVEFVQGRARFEDSRRLRLEGSALSGIRFQHAIVATGSRPLSLPGIEISGARVMDSTSGLELEEIPGTLLVVGGGYIGLELGTVYASLGSRVTLVELTGGLLPGVDRDLVRPLEKRVRQLFAALHLNTRVTAVAEAKKEVRVQLEGDVERAEQKFDKVLLSVGRRPNSEDLGLENTGVQVTDRGFIEVDPQRRTAERGIFAIGDVAGEPMLAHKAMREGKVAAEAIAGEASAFDNLAVPAVVFTDPEVAWCGLTETEAKARGREVKVARFPWAASGRAATLGRSDGLTKLLFEPETGRLLGVGMVGTHAGELMAEGVLALEMAVVAEELASTIHTHPTLSETMGEAAELFLGQAIHIYKK